MTALRGEVWWADLNPTVGREQRGTRPVLVVSHDVLNRGPAELVIACPLTTRARAIRSWVQVEPPEGGVDSTSFVMTEQVRSISSSRLKQRMGIVHASTLGDVAAVLSILLGGRRS